MNSKTVNAEFQGGAGLIEARIDNPADSVIQNLRGVAVIAHPHPLFGGTMDNKVVQTLARAFVQAGWQAVRFNFRGVGASAGGHDEGRGEAEDMKAVISQVAGNAPLALAGFSFGAFVTCNVVNQIHDVRPIQSLVLVGTSVVRSPAPPIAPELHSRTLLLHGEVDDTVPLSEVMQWARPQKLPVTVMPDCGHFFHGQLPLLRELVLRHLQTTYEPLSLT